MADQRPPVDSGPRDDDTTGLFLGVIEHLPIGVHVYRLEPGGHLVFVGANPAADRILGVDNRAFVGKTIEEAFPPLAQTEVPARYREAAADGTPWMTEQISYQHGAIVGAFFVQAFRVGPGAMAAAFLDITERKRAEAALHESRALYHDLVETAQDLIWQVDAQGRYTYVNPAWEAVLGYRAEEMIGKRFSDFQEPEWAERDRREFARLLRGQVVRGLETVHLAKDGREVHLVFNAKSFTDATGAVRGTRGTAFDITERKLAEAERRRLEEQILHAQKLESLGVLAGGIAHDFNNILMSVVGHAGLARMRLEPGAPALENIAQIEVAAERAAELARQMLAYAGRGSFVVGLLDLNALVGEMENLLRVSISKKAALHLDLAEGLPAVEADATQLRQVVMNLVINASEAIGDRPGQILVATACASYPAEALRDFRGVDGPPPGGRYVRLEVADDGCGMTDETRARIFDPFFSSKFTGRGLGLAAVLGIVGSHRGGIRVTSEPGRGSTFTVLLPAAPDAAADAAGGAPRGEAALAPAPAATDTAGREVLLVDDEESVRAIATGMLEAAGFRVTVAGDGVEARERYRERRPDVVLLDLTMPRMDGVQTFRTLRALDPGARIVLSSGYEDSEEVRALAGQGLAGFLRKPYTAEALVRALRGALG